MLDLQDTKGYIADNPATNNPHGLFAKIDMKVIWQEVFCQYVFNVGSLLKLKKT